MQTILKHAHIHMQTPQNTLILTLKHHPNHTQILTCMHVYNMFSCVEDCLYFSPFFFLQHNILFIFFKQNWIQERPYFHFKVSKMLQLLGGKPPQTPQEIPWFYFKQPLVFLITSHLFLYTACFFQAFLSCLLMAQVPVFFCFFFNWQFPFVGDGLKKTMSCLIFK